MRFIHFSDTHLGFSDLNRIDPESGINQREADFYAAWWRVIERILEEKPDFVVHAGDLFQSPRPNNRAIRIALEGVQQVVQAGIPFVVVAGNHSTPRIRQTGSIFESLALFPRVHAAHRSRYERFRIGDCALHCIPHCSLSEELDAAYEAIQPDPKARYQVLVTHGAWRSGSGETIGSVGEFNEQFIVDPESKLNLKFDYIALGHYHKHLAVAPAAVYSGSTERTSFNEIGYTSGYVRVDLAAGKWDYAEIASRPMLGIGPIDCQGLQPEAVYTAIHEQAETVPEGSLLRVELVGLSKSTLLGLEMQEIDRLFPETLHVEKLFRPADDASLYHISSGIGSLPAEFAQFIDAQENLTLDAERLKEMGQGLLGEAEENG